MRLSSLARSAAALLVFAVGCHTASKNDFRFSTREPVGQIGTNRYYTPANQLLTPAGIQVELPGMRPQAIALSPDGSLLVTAGHTHEIVVVDPASGQILQHVPLPANEQAPVQENVSEQILQPDNFGQLSYTGLTFSSDGSRLYLANVNGDVKVFGLNARKQLRGLFTLKLPPAHIGNRTADIPAGIAVS
jgi:DNA-binding beta-propeller fold protein YncE